VHFYTVLRPQCPGSKDILLSFKSTQHLADAAKIKAGQLVLRSGTLSITGTRFFYKSKPNPVVPKPVVPRVKPVPYKPLMTMMSEHSGREVMGTKRDEKDDCQWLKELLGEFDPAVQAQAQGGRAQRSASICEDLMSLWSHSSTNEAGSDEHTAASLSSDDSDSDASIHFGASASSSGSSMCAEFEECSGREEVGGGEATLAVLVASGVGGSIRELHRHGIALPASSSDSVRHSAAISEACALLEHTKPSSPSASSSTNIRVFEGA
jgi:hypothetical protein